MAMATDVIKPGGWKVGTQVTGFVRTGGGQVVEGVTVHFVTSTGTASQVFVPNATYQPSTVVRLIAAKVKYIETIGRSGQSSGG